MHLLTSVMKDADERSDVAICGTQDFGKFLPKSCVMGFPAKYATALQDGCLRGPQTFF